MKRTGSVVAASMAVASSATALATAATYSDPNPSCISDPKFQSPGQKGRNGHDMDDQKRQRSDPTDRFAPRFDGLRFIETLVTAHR